MPCEILFAASHSISSWKDLPFGTSLKRSGIVRVILVVLPPALAVIVAVPTLFAVTLPSPVTEAIYDDDDDHVTVFFVALSGLTVAFNAMVPPVCNVILPSLTPSPSIVTDSTATVGTSPRTVTFAETSRPRTLPWTVNVLPGVAYSSGAIASHMTASPVTLPSLHVASA